MQEVFFICAFERTMAHKNIFITLLLIINVTFIAIYIVIIPLIIISCGEYWILVINKQEITSALVSNVLNYSKFCY